MKVTRYSQFTVFIAGLACGSTATALKQPFASIVPITLGADLAQINGAKAIAKLALAAIR